ncbi:DUF11 domain-containing protein [Occultella glacieicola]|uniref:DUF11 domain-containing protein n=1 Tax=Occultella glacieicola TaxID=2518684 RepID=A0ABY2E466_9MICO|nr:DUF11 domain-containing protein [Occultella glacieicola]TDE94818.1 DUF11 domain-containing protein [Occultella glacieicola]
MGIAGVRSERDGHRRNTARPRRPRRSRGSGGGVLSRLARGALAVALTATALTAAGTLATTTAANAADGDPFDPDVAAVFLAQDRPTTLYRAEQVGADLTFVAEGTAAVPYNAIGYNTVDNYLYGVQQDTQRLLRIGQGGAVTDLGAITGLNVDSYYQQGTFGAGDDDANTLYVRGTLDLGTVYAIDLTTRVATPITLSEEVPNTSDLVVLEGYLWGMGNDSRIWRVDLDSGAAASWETNVPAVTYGGQWVYGNGNLGLSANDSGDVIQLGITNATSANPTFTILSTVNGPTPNSNNDATSNPGPDVDLAILKTVRSAHTPGGTITFGIHVINDSAVTSSGHYFQDELPASLTDLSSPNTECSFVGNLMTCAYGTMAPGEQRNFEVTATAPNSIDPITNTVTVTGNENDPNLDNNTATVTTTPDYAPGVSVVKSAVLDDGSVFADGGTLEYSFLVTNTGNTDLTAITIDEGAFTGTGELGDISCPTTTLASGASTTCTADYTLTQADVDAGGVTNTASANGTPPLTPPITSVPSTFDYEDEADDALTVVKTATPASSGTVGQEITYRFAVTNTGGTTLTGVAIDEGDFSGSGDLSAIECPATTLAPGATTTCTATYVLTQADVDAVGVTNTATATATPPGGGTVDSPPSSVTVETPDSPALTLVKSASPAEVSAIGDTITYGFALTNTGNVTLTGVHVDETAFSGSGEVSAITCPTTTLAPDASTICTASYTLTQADIDNGGVTNTATGGGTPPGGGDTQTPPSTVTVDAPENPALTVTKTSSPVGAAAGNTVTYSFLVTNTGNVTVDAIAIVDEDFSGTGQLSAISCPATTLAPNASTTCTATYTLTQADVDSGELHNGATVTGNTPSDGEVDSPPSEVQVELPPNPSLSVVKTATPASVDDAGAEVSYSFLVINTGNVTLDGIAVQEQDFTGTGELSEIVCPTTTLAPAAQTTCTATYELTQADVDAGGVTNVATATGNPPGSDVPVTSPPSETTVGSEPAPGLSAVKTSSPASVAAAGDVITYSFLLTNTGNVTLSDVAPVEGEFSGTGELSDIECPTTTLAPGEDVTCTATYEVTQEDVDAGGVTNTATATATPPTSDPGGTPVEAPPSETEVDVPPAPGVSLVKSADLERFTSAGEAVVFTFLVTNTGNVTLRDVVVDDSDFSGTGDLGEVVCPAGVLAPAESVTCEATYVVTQADVDAGLLSNTATAVGTPPGTGTPPVDSPPSLVTIEAPHTPGLTLVKTADVPTVTSVGQTVTYSFLVSNTGNVTLGDVAVTEGAFSGAGDLSEVTCPQGAVPPGAQIVCTATYAVQEADLTGDALSNTATASATPPGQGEPITSDPSTTESGSQEPDASLPTTGTRAGSVIALVAAVLLLAGGSLLFLGRRGRGYHGVRPR